MWFRDCGRSETPGGLEGELEGGLEGELEGEELVDGRQAAQL